MKQANQKSVIDDYFLITEEESGLILMGRILATLTGKEIFSHSFENNLFTMLRYDTLAPRGILTASRISSSSHRKNNTYEMYEYFFFSPLRSHQPEFEKDGLNSFLSRQVLIS